MSLSLLLVRTACGFFPKLLGDTAKLHKKMRNREYPSEAPLPASLRRRCHVHKWMHDGQQVITLTPLKKRKSHHILYLHGGAYISAMTSAHWGIIRALMDSTGASITVPSYALSPENDYRRAHALMEAVYEQLVNSRPSESITIAGDSAGGNFALSFTIRRRNAGLPLPHQLVLFSPWMDLAMHDERARTLEKHDVLLAVDGLRECGKWWAGEQGPASPEMSPLYADLTELPPMAIFQGDRDIFVFDTRSFVERTKAANVECHYSEYPQAFHVFMGATFTPEAKDVFNKVGEFLKEE